MTDAARMLAAGLDKRGCLLLVSPAVCARVRLLLPAAGQPPLSLPAPAEGWRVSDTFWYSTHGSYAIRLLHSSLPWVEEAHPYPLAPVEVEARLREAVARLTEVE